MDVDSSEDKELYLPTTSGNYLLTGRNHLERIGHKRYKTRKCRRALFVMQRSSSKAVSIQVSATTHTVVHYSLAAKKIVWSCFPQEKCEYRAFRLSSNSAPCSMCDVPHLTVTVFHSTQT